MRTALIAVTAAALLAGCAVLRSDSSSFVDGLAANDAAPLSAQIADLTAGRVGRGEKVRLAAAQDNALGQAVDAQLKDALTARGIAIAGREDGGGNAHALRYIVTRYGDDLLLRVHLDSAEAATVLVRGPSGGLSPRAPLSVRKVTP